MLASQSSQELSVQQTLTVQVLHIVCKQFLHLLLGAMTVSLTLLCCLQGAQGHLPLNEATRNCIALTGPAVSDEVWQTFPEQLLHCTTGWARLQDMDFC